MIKLKENEIILFQGDSITDGNRGRSADPNHIHGHGYQYLLASELWHDNLDKNPTFINRGISGNRCSELLDRWDEDCINLNPTILSILVGINDIGAMYVGAEGASLEGFESSYRKMLRRVKAELPNTLVIIMEPFFGDKEENEKEEELFFKKHINELQQRTRKIAEEFDAVFVPLQDIFDSYREKTDIFNLIWDGVHPTTCGHYLIAQRWKECVKEAINAIPESRK